jgi:hypothetical protein
VVKVGDDGDGDVGDWDVGDGYVGDGDRVVLPGMAVPGDGMLRDSSTHASTPRLENLIILTPL